MVGGKRKFQIVGKEKWENDECRETSQAKASGKKWKKLKPFVAAMFQQRENLGLLLSTQVRHTSILLHKL
jgi:hypothetical protein